MLGAEGVAEQLLPCALQDFFAPLGADPSTIASPGCRHAQGYSEECRAEGELWGIFSAGGSHEVGSARFSQSV